MRKNGQDHRVLMDHKLINVPQGKSGDAYRYGAECLLITGQMLTGQYRLPERNGINGSSTGRAGN